MLARHNPADDPSGELELETARAYLDAGQIGPAIDAASAAAEKQGETPAVGLVLGSARFAEGGFQEAERLFRAAVKQAPRSAIAHSNLANALGELRRFGEAAAVARKAVELKPDYAEGWSNLGVLLKEADEPEEAEKALRKALALQPKLTEAERNLVVVLIDRKHYREAADMARSLVERYPSSGAAYSALGKANEELGKASEATHAYRRAVELTPSRRDYHTGLLFALHYDPDMTAEAIFAAYRDWDRVHTRELTEANPRPVPSGGLDKRLRVGFLSASFQSHPVGFFTLAGLDRIDTREFERVILDVGTAPDHITRQFQGIADQWVDLSALDDESLAERIREESIDILVDLAGHSRGQRLMAVARRPAPVILKWVGGQLGSTGMDAFDGFITDWFESPEGSEALYSERLYRLPNDYICYAPPDYAPAVAELPARDNGHVTFGCFNKLAKVSDPLLAVWARILGRVDGAKLILKAAPLDDPGACDLLRERFRQQGGDPDALILRGWSKHRDLLETYNEVDVALDTWPYSGGLTTCEALWMGVPVVTLPGPTFAGRHSASHLANAGLDDWIVASQQAYEDRAVAVAGNLAGLEEMRGMLRQQVARSPLCDATAFARNLGHAFRQAWREACERAGVDGTATGPEAGGAPETDSRQAQSTGGNGQDDLATVVARAERLLMDGHVEEAGRICLAATRVAPGAPEVSYLAGLVNLATGNPEKALEHLEKALTAKPWDPRINRVVAEALAASGDAERAEPMQAVAGQLAAIADGRSGADLAAVMAALERGDTGEARESLDAIVADSSDRSEAAFLQQLLHSAAEAGSTVQGEVGTTAAADDAATSEAGEAGSGLVRADVNAADGRRLAIFIARPELYRVERVFRDHAYALPEGLTGCRGLAVADIGAHVGAFTLYALGWGEATSVCCFEPDPRALDLLERNLEDVPRVRMLPFAISDREEDRTLQQHADQPGLSRFGEPFEGGASVTVPVLRTDQGLAAARFGRADVLRISAGEEPDRVLEGLGERLSEVAVVMAEYDSDARRRRIDELLSSFSLYDIQVGQGESPGLVKYLNSERLSQLADAGLIQWNNR